MQKVGSFDCCCSISQWRRRLSACVRAHGGHFGDVFMIQCAKLMLRIFEFNVLLFDCFVYCQNEFI